MQNPLYLFLTILTSREEIIFMVRILIHQAQEEGRTLRDFQMEIMKGERRREELENLVYQSINETTHRKLFLPKVVQKFTKIQTYYVNKTKIFFPKQGQQLCQENLTQPNLRNIINNMSQESLVFILRYISNLQKMRLKYEIGRASYVEREDRCNRNEKFYTEPLLTGNFGMHYINRIHSQYYFLASQRSQKNVYDVLLLDDQTKSLYLQGGGFTSVIGNINKQKKINDTPQIYVPIETTQEIITTRYEKLLKELMDMNGHIQKSIHRYTDYHQKRRRNKETQNRIKITTTRHSQQVKMLNLSDFGKLSAPSSRYSRTRQLKTQLSCMQSPSEPQFKYQFWKIDQQMHQLKFMKYFQEATFSLKQKFGYAADEEALKLFDQAYHYESTILPINLLDKISELSFQMEHYPKIINQIVLQLSTYGVTPNVILKTLIITDYLLKYGCSGIIDDLKVRVYLFRNYQEFKIDYQDPLYTTIRSKAGNIANQLTNRKLLYKEKEIAKQMKLKIQMNKQKTQSISSNSQENNKTNTLDDILENYIFKYMDKFNDKLEAWGDQVNEKLDVIIDNLSQEQAFQKDENGYYFPESCMEEITIVRKNNNRDPIDFKEAEIKAQKDLLQFEDEKQSNQKKEINLLD